jgi:heat-inducible transcriptional repressor
MQDLEPRAQDILEAIVTEYLSTGDPVGSRTISKKLDSSLSPASVRNVMSDLTDMGLIIQPHISAGRIPTDSAIRFYVDAMMKNSLKLSPKSKEIESLINTQAADIRDILRRASSVLAELSRQAGVVTTPTAVEQTFKTIDFIKVAGDKILVILVSTTGFVLNKLIYDRDNVNQETLERYGRIINDMLKDLDLRQARRKIEIELATEKTMVDAMLTKALRLGHAVLSVRAEGEIFIEGQTHLLDDPEFAQVEKLKAVLITFEEKSKLLNILEQILETNSLQILVGEEHGLQEMESCSIVAYPVKTEESVAGIVAVVGPKRMNYKKIGGLVYNTGLALGNVLKRAN